MNSDARYWSPYKGQIYRVTPHDWVEEYSITTKRYSSFPKAPSLLEPHHQIVKSHIKDIRSLGVTPLQKCSWLDKRENNLRNPQTTSILTGPKIIQLYRLQWSNKPPPTKKGTIVFVITKMHPLMRRQFRRTGEWVTLLLPLFTVPLQPVVAVLFNCKYCIEILETIFTGVNKSLLLKRNINFMLVYLKRFKCKQLFN